tara:strand:+ start:3259 stop:3855 length:597 start_codon:yes stop_codon:yes gene_type:complete
MKPLLIIFCKNLIEGQVKTRLAKSIGTKKALLVYKKLIEKTVEEVKLVNSQKVVYYSKFINNNDKWNDFVNEKKIQKGNNLGEKINNAFSDGFKSKFSPIIIIGSDLWDIKHSDINLAFNFLTQNDYVIGPSIDGGYYLIGMNTINSKLFKSKSWSKSTLLKETINELKNKKLKLLDSKNDIDTLEDLNSNETLKKML